MSDESSLLKGKDLQLQKSLSSIHDQIELAATIVLNRNEFVMNLMNYLYEINKASIILESVEYQRESEEEGDNPVITTGVEDSGNFEDQSKKRKISDTLTDNQTSPDSDITLRKKVATKKNKIAAGITEPISTDDQDDDQAITNDPFRDVDGDSDEEEESAKQDNEIFGDDNFTINNGDELNTPLSGGSRRHRRKKRNKSKKLLKGRITRKLRRMN